MGRDISAELDRLLPSSLAGQDTAKIRSDFAAFLNGLTKKEHAEVITLLPDRPQFDVRTETSLIVQTTPEQSLVDDIGRLAIVLYIKHVAPREIIAHLLNELRSRPGKDVRRLVLAMSRNAQILLFDELIRQDRARGKAGRDIVAEFNRKLNQVCNGFRLGFFDYLLAAVLEKHLAAKTRTTPVLFEITVLREIQGRRRQDPARLPTKITLAYEARFIVEEALREFFHYLDADKQIAYDRCAAVYDWYKGGKVYRNHTVRSVDISSEIGQFFEDLHNIGSVGKNENLWTRAVKPLVESEDFWNNIRALNDEIPYEQSELAYRDAVRRQGAALGLGIYSVGVLLPIFIVVTGGVGVRLIIWTADSLVLAGQYAYTTYKVYGLVAGAAKVATDVYQFYMRDPVEINSLILNGMEFSLDIFGCETGLAPGTSPADMADSATRIIQKTARSGVVKLIEHSPEVLDKASVKIEKVLLPAVDSLTRAKYDLEAIPVFAQGRTGMFKVVKASPADKGFKYELKITLVPESSGQVKIIEDVEDVTVAAHRPRSVENTATETTLATRPAIHATDGELRTLDDATIKARGADRPATGDIPSTDPSRAVPRRIVTGFAALDLAEADAKAAARLDTIIRTGGPLPPRRGAGAAIVDVPGYTAQKELRALSALATDTLGSRAPVFHVVSPAKRAFSRVTRIRGSRHGAISHVNDVEIKLLEYISANLPPNATGTIHITSAKILPDGSIGPLPACPACTLIIQTFQGEHPNIRLVPHAASETVPTFSLD